jgi:Ca-activated chloride channel family protein
MKTIRITIICIACFLSALNALPSNAQTDPGPVIAGQVVAQHNGKRITLPLLKSDYEIEIDDTVATVKITQHFSNPNSVALNAQYLFPLNQHAAVFAMQMHVGDEIIDAVIQENSVAQKTYETAKAEGKAAALLTQHRPNMFTQRIANLMPNAPIKVTLSYVQTIPKIDNDYSLIVPMIVSPRFGQPKVFDNATGWKVDAPVTYPDVAGLNLPKDDVEPRITMVTHIKSNLPITGLTSDTHELLKTELSNGKRLIFKDSAVLDNRDFILNYALAGDTLQAGAWGEFTQQGGFASIVVEPPKVIPDAMVTPRELIFLIDTSGSQGGQPLQASKTFMSAALSSLRPDDYFRIVQFQSSVTSFANDAMPATRQNILAGKRFVQNLNAGGGTDIDRAIRASFATKRVTGTLPIVVFLSDGLVGNEAEVIKRIRRDIGDTRIYSFGVGTSVNRYLMDGVARQGRGYARYIDPTDDASEVAVKFASDLKTPVLTDISVDWGELDASQSTPHVIPDLFEGGTVRIFTRYKAGGTYTIKVKGKVNGVAAQLPMEITLPTAATNTSQSPLALTWARRQIAAKTLDYNTRVGDRATLKDEIIALGLSHSLQSKFTSFVAVSKRVYNQEPDATQTKAIALPKVSGMSKIAYPSTVTGSSTPEPETVFGFLLALLMGLGRFHKTLRSYLSVFISKAKGV